MADLLSGMELLENYHLVLNVILQNYKKFVEDPLQAVSLQEKELEEKIVLVADLQGRLEHSGKSNLSCSFQVRSTLLISLLFPPCRYNNAESHPRGGKEWSCYYAEGATFSSSEGVD
jgi:hypothetical protein